MRVYDMIMPTFRKDIEYYQGSLLDSVSMGMAMNGIDAVFHLAAVADVNEVYKDPHYSESINTRGTINVLEAARRSDSVKRLIYASTVWVYSDTTEAKVDEFTNLPPPSHLYTATKLAGEYYCKSYYRLYGLDTTILRYGIPYGPRARGAAVIPIFVKKALNGDPITIQGDGMQFRKFVYVEDLAEGNVYGLKSIAKNRTYNLEGTEKVSIRQIAETVQKLIGGVEIEFSPARPGDFSGQEISTKLAKEELGWEAKTKFEEGLKKYIEWYKDEEEKKKSAWKNIDALLRKHL